MEEIIFVVDESGAKGYSSNKEQYPGELGVVAGYMFPGKLIEEVRTELHELFQPFIIDGKLHITDLNSIQQGQLRNMAFDFLERHRAPWVYEAIYVHGLHSAVSRSNEISEKTRKEASSKIKFSDRPEIELLHAKIFSGAAFKAMAFVMNRGLHEFKITIITDRVDASIAKNFREELDTLLGAGQEHSYEAKGYNVETNKIVRETYSIKVTVDEPLAIDLTGIDYEIRSEDSPVTLVADVLANSVHYHLKKMQQSNPRGDLNCEKAISGHPLHCSLYGNLKGDIPWITDSLYAHPGRTDGT